MGKILSWVIFLIIAYVIICVFSIATEFLQDAKTPGTKAIAGVGICGSVFGFIILLAYFFS